MHSVESIFVTPGKLHNLKVQATFVFISHTGEWDRGRMYPNTVAL